MRIASRAAQPRTRLWVAGPVVALVVALVVAIAGIAVAQWSTSGSGSAAAETDTPADLTLTPATPAAALYPGGSTAVVLSVHNPGVATVRVNALALATGEAVNGFEVDAAHPDCDEQALSYTTQTNGGAGWSLPAGGTLAVTLAGALALSSGADDGCQGATFTVHLVAS